MARTRPCCTGARRALCLCRLALHTVASPTSYQCFRSGSPSWRSVTVTWRSVRQVELPDSLRTRADSSCGLVMRIVLAPLNIHRQNCARSRRSDEQESRGGEKKYAVLAGVNEPKKSCHGVRKARAEVVPMPIAPRAR
jgi:hypothetical protein